MHTCVCVYIYIHTYTYTCMDINFMPQNTDRNAYRDVSVNFEMGVSFANAGMFGHARTVWKVSPPLNRPATVGVDVIAVVI